MPECIAKDIRTPDSMKHTFGKYQKNAEQGKERYEGHQREVGQWHGGAPGSRSLHASIALVLRVDLACWQGCSFLGEEPRSAF